MRINIVLRNSSTKDWQIRTQLFLFEFSRAFFVQAERGLISLLLFRGDGCPELNLPIDRPYERCFEPIC